MAKASVGGAWERAIRFVRAEWRLLAPVALFFYGTSAVLAQLAFGPDDLAALQAGRIIPSTGWLILPSGLLMLAGGLALSALALQRELTVGQALRRAVERLPVLLGIAALSGLALFAVATLLTFVAAFSASGDRMTAAATLAMLMLPGMAIAAVILSLATPLLVSERAGVLAAITRTWRLSAGSRAKLVGVCAVFFLFGIVLSGITALIVGLIAIPVARAAGSDELAQLAVMLASGVVQAAFSTVTSVWFAEFYRALVSAPTVPRSGI